MTALITMKTYLSAYCENPLDCGLESSKPIFGVTVKDKITCTIPRLDDVTFYIMEEANHLYNSQNMPYPKQTTKADPEDVEPVRRSDWLIFADFKPDYLFQDLRIAFYYRHYEKINTIKLQH